MALAKDSTFGNARSMLARIDIEQQNARFGEAVAAGDADALAALYTENAIAMPPSQPILEGRDAIREDFAAMFDSGVDGVDIETVELVRRDDMAIERSNLTVRVGGEEALQGKALVVWVLVDDEWLMARDMWSWNTPDESTSN